MNKLKMFLIMAIAIFSLSAVDAQITKKQRKAKKETSGTHYQCPMKCEGEKTYHKAEKCPVCNMQLKAVKASEAHVETYQCPMKCEGEKTYAKPGKCSVCGMDLKKVETKSISKASLSKVNIVGAMMNVIHKGELFGTINLDTIADKQHLYGLGPIEYLKGEILIVDGKSYVSRVASDGSIAMEEAYKVKAPFFVSENVSNWKEVALPDSIQTIPQLETFLDENTKNHSRPFAFKLIASIDNCSTHIVNLPTGTVVHSPDDAHKNQQSYDLKNVNAEMIGFFSTEHQGIFTHHDTYVHIHLITDDKKQMGHLEELMLKKGTAKLYLPTQL